MVSTPNFTDGTWNIVSTLHTDGDPNGDILWQNIADQSMVLWQQDGATTTAVTDLPSLDDFEAVLVGDFDGDGKADQFLRKEATGADKILLSSTGAIGNTATLVDTNWTFSAAADFSGDGKDDIFSFYNTTGLLQTWEMNGTIVTDTKFLASGYGSGDLLHAVFNGESFSTFDSLWFDQSASNYNITSYTGGVQTVTDTFTVQAGNEFVNKGDYNGDGDADFFFRGGVGSDAGSIEIVFTNEITETGRLNFDADLFNNTVRFEAGGDFDGDGIFEVLGRNPVGGETFVMNTVGGNEFTQSITGSSGADLIDGREGNDTIHGGAGDDILIDSGTSGSNADRLFGGDGNDLIDGGAEDDSLFGGTGNDILQGGTGNDVLNGGFGDDMLTAGNGTDFLFGDAGDDILRGGSFGFDHMRGGTGNDILLGGSDRGTMEGDSGDDQMYGGSSNDVMFGGSGNDFMVGGLSSDTIYGGSGNDIIVGVDIGGTSGTDDTLYGGSGGDFFYLGNDDTNFYTGSGEAYIMDFSQAAGDFVMLNGTAANYTFVDTGADVEIRQSSDSNVIAVVRDVGTAAEVSDNAIYIG
jgi:Ca2+-binding RTX toxin-like protein